MNSLYKERLLEIYAEKKCFGELKGKTHESRMKNPGCDDEIFIELKVENGKIADAKFHGKACFVSAVSAEILMENIIGMALEDLKNLEKKDIDKFLGIEISSTRTGCELFPLEALKKIDEIKSINGRKNELA